MTVGHDVAWAALAALGAYHGLNPAMGWLFAVSRGMQQGERRAVVRSLGPIALGHELSIALVALVVLGAARVVDTSWLHVGAAVALVAFGIFRFARPRAHPRWTTMRVNGRELTLWSFLMSSAHGAGLMVAPVLLGAASADAGASGPAMCARPGTAGLCAGAGPGHAAHRAGMDGLLTGSGMWTTGLGLALHLAAMLTAMGVVALVVYEKLGVNVLRRAWINTDGLWAGAFIVAGVATLVL